MSARMLSIKDVISAGVPPFTESGDFSSPANSSPYCASRTELFEVFKDDPWRLTLLESADTILNDLEVQGISIPAFLIGGGFVRRLKGRTRPTDIDGLAFYTASNLDSKIVAELLHKSKLKAKLNSIDLRYCPLDSNPLIIIKSSIFYSSIFSKRKNRSHSENGLILYNRNL